MNLRLKFVVFVLIFLTNTNVCPTVQSDNMNALSGFSGQPPRKYDQFSPTYNEGWRDHMNLRYVPRPQFIQANPRSFVITTLNLSHLVLLCRK